MAATTGHADLVGCLVAHGAPPPGLPPADHPGLAGEVRAARPALVTRAAACRTVAAVILLVELGFDVNAKGRTDVPSDQPWPTALHKAAEDGDLELTRTLLRLGADPYIRDARFGSTPLGWARYFGRQALVDLLEPLTS